MKLSPKIFSLMLLTAGMALPWVGHAQDESAPQEAPFMDEANEFEDSMTSENDVFSDTQILETAPVEPAPEVVPAPTQPVVNSPSQSGPRVQRRNAKGGVEYIQHPQAAQGLIRIEKDGTYVYKAKDKEVTKKPESISVRLGAMNPPKIQAVDGTTFVQMYSSSDVPVLLIDYEWEPFSSFGKIKLVGGAGLMTVSGNGRFADGTEAKEKYTFYALPVNLGLIYRMEFMDTQWVAPYLTGGGSYVGVIESRDDGKSPQAVGVPGAYGGGGMLFNISAIDRDTAFTLRNEYGIRNLWAIAEYRYLKTFSDDLDFSSGILNIGIAVDY